MPAIQVLTEILAIIFSHASVPTALSCERVCKRWSIIIRHTHVVQVWEYKLVAEFPLGCLPVLYGHENWRDVSILWFAWNRFSGRVNLQEHLSMTRTPVKELEFGDLIPSVGERIVRDLTGGMYTFEYDVLGVMPHGTAVVKPVSHGESAVPFIDTLFSTTEPDDDDSFLLYAPPISKEVTYTRTNYLIHWSQTARKYIISDLKTHEMIGSIPLPEGHYGNHLCGSVLSTFDTTTPQDMISAHFITPTQSYSQSPSDSDSIKSLPLFQPPTVFNHHTQNEHLAASLHPLNSRGVQKVTLRKIKTQNTIATTTLHIPHVEKIHLT
ncbi:hypothetical protein HK097_003903, partial [Rhizophlyctis rosea]